ncbi:CBS domain-containing protein, partial [Candidatus Uhrbacteria bacterium]|nr:CBS domain-containing protein [Candidatus Uhrbacteria bacterium]
MKVKDIMSTEVPTIHHEATYEEAAKIFHDEVWGGAFVIDEEGKPLGYLSEKDLFRVLYPFYSSFYESPELYLNYETREDKVDEVRQHKIKTFMSKELVTIDAEAPVLRAGALMLARHIHHLPVMENGKMLGVVSREHL